MLPRPVWLSFSSCPIAFAWAPNSDPGLANPQPPTAVYRLQTIAREGHSLLQLVYMPKPDGDYSDDGTVDAADYVVWRKTDGTRPGYDTWRTHFGETFGSGSGASANATVPEPATLVMLIMAAAASIPLRRRRIT